MAQIRGTTQEKIFQLKAWGGLNENPDGDTKLKIGEASVMTNWKVTRDGNMKRRPGSEFVSDIYSARSIVYAESSIPTGTAESLTVYTIARTDSLTGEANTGRIILAGTSSTITLADISGLSGDVYYWYKNRAYKLDRTSTDAWKGFRATVKNSGGTSSAVKGMWSGYINQREVFLIAGDNYVYELLFDGSGNVTRQVINPTLPINTDIGVHMFGFNNKVYFLDGHEYYQWDGTTFAKVDGYTPLVAITIPPEGGGETLEAVNLLHGRRRVWLSPNGENATFQLPETNWVDGSLYATDLATLNPITISASVPSTGTITFDSIPPQSVNSIEVGWTMPNSVVAGYRAQVTAMRYSELYSGTQDTRVFLYGDGSNMAIYSGIDYDGDPRADYFPDMNSIKVGDENTPITAMIRHYSTLVCYKVGSAWSINYGIMSLSDSMLTPAFYATPVNRLLGNDAFGQVRLVNNSPVTLAGGEVYQWTNSSYYSSNLTQDERQARRISDRIQKSIKEFKLPQCYCWDDNYGQEYYICYDGDALVWNYAADAWYKYENFDSVCMVNFQGALFYGTSDGRVLYLTYDVPEDDFEPIEAYWESGAMDFGQGYMRKYSAMLWVGIKPDEDTAVTVTVKSDRKEEYNEKIIAASKARVAGEPFLTKSKIKVKKFAYYTLIFKSDGDGEAPTVLGADIRVRFTGYMK